MPDAVSRVTAFSRYSQFSIDRLIRLGHERGINVENLRDRGAMIRALLDWEDREVAKP